MFSGHINIGSKMTSNLKNAGRAGNQNHSQNILKKKPLKTAITGGAGIAKIEFGKKVMTAENSNPPEANSPSSSSELRNLPFLNTELRFWFCYCRLDQDK